MKNKQRLSVSVDSDLIAAAEKAVARGEAPTLSAWVNEALRSKLEHDRRVRNLRGFIETYEAEYGEITEDEMERAERNARARAIVIRGEADRPDPGLAGLPAKRSGAGKGAAGREAGAASSRSRKRGPR